LTKAEKIIAVSKNTKTDIVEEFGIPEDRIEVVYEGVLDPAKELAGADNLESVKNKYGIKDKYVLFLGTVEPRKNLLSLIRAFRNLRMVYDSPLIDFQLIIAGGRGWRDKAIYEAIEEANASISGKKLDTTKGKKSGTKNKSAKKKTKSQNDKVNLAKGLAVKYIGYISHAEKTALLSGAVCFVFPSIYEGFGLPVLEAMSLGTPVITSNISSLPEVVGERGGITVNPLKEAEIGDAINSIVTDDGLRESISINAKAQASKFTWRKCAEDTLVIYEGLSPNTLS